MSFECIIKHLIRLTIGINIYRLRIINQSYAQTNLNKFKQNTELLLIKMLICHCQLNPLVRI